MRGKRSAKRIIKVQPVISQNVKLLSQIFNLLDFCKCYAVCFKKFWVSKIKESFVCVMNRMITTIRTNECIKLLID